VSRDERISAILPELDEMIGGELVTLERAHVLMYRPGAPTPRPPPPTPAQPAQPGDTPARR